MNRFFGACKMIIMFIVLNILITMTAFILTSAICAYFGINLNDYPFMFYLVFYSIIGFGGAFISLQLSRYMAKKVFKIRLLTRAGTNPDEQKIIDWVEQLTRKARLPVVPEIGIFESSEVNAFATGPSKSRSLVAVSTGLLSTMEDAEVEGVLAHEIAHIQNGDMVTMALIQGLVNTMVLILARIAATFVMSFMRRRSFFMEYMLFIAFQMVLNLLGAVLVVNVFSRIREYRADKGGARLAGRDKMIQALKRLKIVVSKTPLETATANYNTFKIQSGDKKPSFVQQMFSTHPPLDQRIEALERMTVGV